MADDQAKQRFEPPPWERDAFERFQQEQARIKAREEQARVRDELNAALQQVRDGVATTDQQAEAPAIVETPVVPTAPATQGEPAAAPVVPEAKIAAMLIQLRGEEKPGTTVPMALVNGVIAFMTASGLYIIVQAALLFAGARSSDTSATMLAATASFMVFVTGLGFIGAAVLLFRKYHR